MSITFGAPYGVDTLTLDLPNPSLGDSVQLNLKTTVKQVMNGKYYTHKRIPVSRKMLLTFTCLTRTEKSNLQSFYRYALGREISYLDYLNQLWKVRLVNNTLLITTRQDECTYEATLEVLSVEEPITVEGVMLLNDGTSQWLLNTGDNWLWNS